MRIVHKHRVETETEVSNGDALAEIFQALGLVAAFRYEKWRSEWSDGIGHCVIDETPIGDYAELEGPAEWIDQVAPRLGIESSDYITLSYGRLFEQWREENQCDANDLTFAAVAASSSASIAILQSKPIARSTIFHPARNRIKFAARPPITLF